MLSLKVDDYRPKEHQIVIRESKGREPRTLPVSPKWVEASNVWLRQRSKSECVVDTATGEVLPFATVHPAEEKFYIK